MTEEPPATPDWDTDISSRAYRITVDGGRESFYALSIEDATHPDGWLMSDTVVALETMR